MADGGSGALRERIDRLLGHQYDLSDLDRLQGQLEWEITFEDLLLNLLLAGAIDREAYEDALDPARPLVRAFKERFSEGQRRTLPAALAAGATPRELLDLGVHGRNCEGEDLPLLTPAELRERMEAAARLGQGKPTAWLLGYVERLNAEVRRRKAGHGLVV